MSAVLNASDITDVADVLREKMTWCTDLFGVIADQAEHRGEINQIRIARLAGLGEFIAGLTYSDVSDLNNMADAAETTTAAIRKAGQK